MLVFAYRDQSCFGDEFYDFSDDDDPFRGRFETVNHAEDVASYTVIQSNS